MGTIVERRRKDGTVAYMAKIQAMRDGKIVLRETQTFDRRPAATAWIRRRESEISKAGGIELALARVKIPTLGAAIERYIAESERKIGRTKAQVLRSILASDIAAMQSDAIKSPDIVAFARDLRGRVAPQTVANYLAHLGAVFSIARPAWGIPLDPQAMADAQKVAKRLGITTKSRERDRRPSLDELDKLLSHFVDAQRRRPRSSPMAAIVALAIFSTRRLDELSRMKWTDLDKDSSRILIRDMKNPGEKIGNNVLCDLPPEALRIILAQPNRGPTIIQASATGISARFTRACKLLGIEDLHFHDLRHDGISRLFELGNTIPRVAAVSGHRSWISLKRYTHLRQSGDKFAKWEWLDRLAPKTQKSPAPA